MTEMLDSWAYRNTNGIQHGKVLKWLWWLHRLVYHAIISKGHETQYLWLKCYCTCVDSQHFCTFCKPIFCVLRKTINLGLDTFFLKETCWKYFDRFYGNEKMYWMYVAVDVTWNSIPCTNLPNIYIYIYVLLEVTPGVFYESQNPI